MFPYIKWLQSRLVRTTANAEYLMAGKLSCSKSKTQMALELGKKACALHQTLPRSGVSPTPAPPHYTDDASSASQHMQALALHVMAPCTRQQKEEKQQGFFCLFQGLQTPSEHIR